MNSKRLVFASMLMMLFSYTCQAHTGSTAFLSLNGGDSIHGEWLMPLQALDLLLDINLDGDGALTQAEFIHGRDKIRRYAEKNLIFAEPASSCEIRWKNPIAVKHRGDTFARVPLSILCGKQTPVPLLRYTGFFSVDPFHRAVVQFDGDGSTNNAVQLISSEQRDFNAESNKVSALLTFFALVYQGIVHILIGYDHLLFLFALIVPILLYRVGEAKKKKYQQQADNFSVWLDLTKLITAFTLGHSVTLVLATLTGWSPPLNWVESIIAMSVIVAGLNIIVPLFRHRDWPIALCFGLIHGFGFASVLQDLELSREALVISLLGFNLGVEFGQLFVVLCVAPLLVFAARYPWTNFVTRYASSLLVVFCGSLWVLQRSF